MIWRGRVLRGRLRDQAPVVAMVVVVAVAATTLVGVLAGLLHLAQTQAVPAAVGRLSPELVRIEATLWTAGEDPVTVLDKGRGAVAQITGDVPTSETVWQIGRLHALPRPAGSPLGTEPHLAYLASLPRSDENTRLLDGRWPDAGADASGATEVAVPAAAAQEKDWQVGTRIDARPWDGDTVEPWVVVGTYEAVGPTSAWSHDRLRGGGRDDTFNVPGSAGMRRTVAWGPLIVDPAALTRPGQVDTTYLTVDPRLAEASPDALTLLRDHVRDGSATLSDALQPEANGRISTQVDRTVDSVRREVVVTRAGVLAVGLLLATLAATVMLLAARLLAERRAAESELLAARGAAPAQLRSAVVVEAVALAALTWLATPWLARTALDALTRQGDLAAAGYQVGPGVAAPVTVTCAAMAVALATALCVPAWHTAGSSSATTHAGLLRAGGDLALLVLAVLAVAQLVAYGSPLAAGGGGPGVDVVLVAGPALVALAASTLALRLVVPVGRLADGAAARARSFVLPLAAWQVSRRASVARGTVLVVVVAVVSGTFSAAFLATWRTSQREQVDIAVGTDLRVDDLAEEPLTASATLAAATADHADAHAQPVVDRAVGVGPRGNVGGGSARLIALDASRPQDVRGWSGTGPEELLDGLADARPDAGVGADVPPGTGWVVAAGRLTTEPATTGTAMVHLAVEDDRGVLVPLAARTVPLGEPFRVGLEVAPRTRPLRVVAVGGVVTPEHLPGAGPVGPQSVRLSLEELRAVPAAGGFTLDSVVLTQEGTSIALSAAGWSGSVRQPPRQGPATVEGGLTAAGPGHGTLEVTARPLAGRGPTSTPTSLLAQAWQPTKDVPAVVSSAMLRDLDLRPGSGLTLDVAGTSVDVRVERVVDQVPGAPRDPAVLLDRTALARAVVEAGGASIDPDAWWVAAPGTTAAAVADALDGTGAVVRTRTGLADEALSGPVRVAVPAALSLVTGAAVLLVLVGTGTVAAGALRARRLELARLQALGASRAGLMGGMFAESALLVVLGAVVGLLCGYGLAAVVAPLLTMSPDGRTPVPTPVLVWDWGGQTARGAAVVVGACAVVAVVVALGVRRTSGAALRMGDDR